MVIISVFGEGQQISGGWSWWNVSNRSCNKKCLAVCCVDCTEVPLLLSELCLTPLSSGDHLWETGKEKGAPSHIGVDSAGEERMTGRGKTQTSSGKNSLEASNQNEGRLRKQHFLSPEILG